MWIANVECIHSTVECFIRDRIDELAFLWRSERFRRSRRMSVKRWKEPLFPVIGLWPMSTKRPGVSLFESELFLECLEDLLGNRSSPLLVSCWGADMKV